ncbi:hypothetical protein Bealeia1_01277 [Candidatus Bealeia paramacronuclearis]|uniref:DUF6468 domain-containing protein n=1 Tax=Candidatus Bealeia paramacronuclearis TaxID=1921001 RepID=A0ABZ2C6V1_9PROT|nr:hypothetical protein [Candidatus Bealeia paramacronuclearis]
MTLSIAIDIVFSVLLLATIAYAISLNKKLTIIYNSREELRGLLENFALALERADVGINELKRTANTIGSDLDKQIKLASTLKDDLLFLNDRGEKLANRLEKDVRTPTAPPPSVGSSKMDINISEGDKPIESKEGKLLKSLRGLR